MSTTINPKDSKWQVSDEFKPDKEDLWPYPAEKDGWVLAHNMIRDEVNQIISGLQSTASKFPNSTPAWAVESIKQIWSHHYDVIVDHHRNEDEIMTPFMKERVKLPDKLVADHDVLMTKLREVQNRVESLKEGESLDTLIALVETYKTTMFPHLQEEEQIALLLLRAYFTPEEVKPKIEEVLKTIGVAELGSFINSMSEKYFRSTFMKQEGIPFFVWYLNFRGAYNHYLSNVKPHLDALEGGSPLSAAPRKKMFWLF